MQFEVQESDRFRVEMEEAVFWLYSHNLEQSEEFADRKHFELLREVTALKSHLKRNPRMGQADDVSEIRRFPLYSGRYWATWILIEARKTAILLEFIDSKYPKELRQVDLDDESEI